MTAAPMTNMAAESAWSGDAFEQKYAVLRKSVLNAYRARRALRAVDGVVSAIEDRFAGSAAAPVDRPLFVLGNFRSGTTFLENALSTHPALGGFTYTTSVFPRSPQFADLMRRLIPGLMERSATPHQPNMTMSGDTPFEAEAIWRFCRNNPWSNAPSNVLGASFSDPPFEQLLQRTVVKQLRLLQRPRFLHKNPANTVRLGFLARVFPDARFIYIVRNPLRMLRSQLDMAGTFRRLFPEGTALDYGEAFSNFWLPPAKMFMRTKRHPEISAAFARDPALGLAMSITDVHGELERMVERNGLHSRVHTLRYEDLIAHFEKEMNGILAFAELDDLPGRDIPARQAKEVDDQLLSQRSPLPAFSAEALDVLRPLCTRFDYPTR